MAESAEPQPGRPRKPLSDDIVQLLETTDNRAMTLGMITEQVDGSRRTVDDRLNALVNAGRVESQKIGNATAYWIPKEPPSAVTSDGGFADGFIYEIKTNATGPSVIAMLLGTASGVILAASSSGVRMWFGALVSVLFALGFIGQIYYRYNPSRKIPAEEFSPVEYNE